MKRFSFDKANSLPNSKPGPHLSLLQPGKRGDGIQVRNNNLHAECLDLEPFFSDDVDGEKLVNHRSAFVCG